MQSLQVFYIFSGVPVTIIFRFAISVSILYVSDWCLLSWVKHFSLIIMQLLKPIKSRAGAEMSSVQLMWRTRTLRAVGRLSRHWRILQTADRNILRQLLSLLTVAVGHKQKFQGWRISFGEHSIPNSHCPAVRGAAGQSLGLVRAAMPGNYPGSSWEKQQQPGVPDSLDRRELQWCSALPETPTDPIQMEHPRDKHSSNLSPLLWLCSNGILSFTLRSC